jgi:hypothetical protein
MRIYFHPLKEPIIQELPNIADFPALAVIRQRIQVEINTVGKVEISNAALNDKVDQLLVGQVPFNHHVGDHLRDEVFQVISIFTPVDNWVYSFG